jgi:hypothetical protein
MAIGERAALAGAEAGPAVVKLGRAGEGAAVWAEAAETGRTGQFGWCKSGLGRVRFRYWARFF